MSYIKYYRKNLLVFPFVFVNFFGSVWPFNHAIKVHHDLKRLLQFNLILSF
jgi:hypothetical protein